MDFTSWFLTKFGYGIMSSRYSNFIPEGGGLADLLRTVLTNPAIVFSESFGTEKLEFIAQMILPLASIPVRHKKAASFAFAYAALLINLCGIISISILFSFSMSSAHQLLYFTELC